MLIHRRAVICAVFALGLRPGQAAGADASAWVRGLHSAVRLLNGGRRAGAGAPLQAAVEITLDPRFKTYWRFPGDSGVPPQFSFHGSTNLADARVLFPAPERFPDGAGGHAIGYERNVVLPIIVTPIDPALPVGLAVQADYAVCEKMCIPERAEVRLSLSDGASLHADRIGDAMAKVPRRTPMGGGGAVRLLSAQRGGNGAISLTIEAGEAPRDVFVESASDWYFDVGAPRTLAGGRHGVDIKAASRPSDATRAADITVTIVGQDEAIEVPLSLDVAMLAP